MPEQRKMVTALFCDLVGSTELSGVLEPETLRSVVLRYFETMRAGIEAHGGTVEKFIGDAVMAVFGVPVVHEDDAHRAAAAALGMLAALDGLNAELERDVGSTLAVRIGLNSGEVVTSGEAADGTMVSGEVVNVAARLEQAAAPGRILVGPATRTLLGAAAVVEPVGALTLKGKREPVDAYRLVALVPEAEGVDPPDESRPATPFVGREEELGRLDAAWQAVRTTGSGRLVRITGEAGLGKTRLLREWLAAAAGDGAAVGTGRCHSYGDDASLAPLAEAVGDVLATPDAPSRGPGHLADPDRGARGGGSPEETAYEVLRGGLLTDGTPSPSAQATWAALASVLGGLAALRPVVLVVDDCQWARPLLLEGLSRLRRALAGAPVLLVCAGRPDAGEPLSGVDDEIALGPLGIAASTRLAAALTAPGEAAGRDGSADADGAAGAGHADATDAVVRRAEGNPLYLEELLAMVEDGADPDDLPVTVTAVLSARIDVLGGPEREVLGAGAVAGRRFAVADVRRLLERGSGNGRNDASGPRDGGDAPGTGPGPRPDAGTGDDASLRAALRVLVRRGLVEPVPGAAPAYQFRTGLLRDVAYRGLSKRQRAEWHERLAREAGTGAAVAAHHVEQAYLHWRDLGPRDGHTERLRATAAEALARAGRHALARADLSWSAELHQRALAHSTHDDPFRTRAVQGLGETLLALGRSDEGAELLREALATAWARGDRLAHAHARLQLASLGPEAGPEPAADAARAGLKVFRAADDRLGLARACVRLAQERQLAGRHRAAGELLEEAVAHAVAARAAPELAMALGALGVSLWHGPAPAADAVRRCRAMLAEHGPGNAVVTVTVNYPLANLLALSGRSEEARACLATAARFATGLGYAEVAGFAPLFSAGVEALADAPETAERLLREAVAQCREVGGPSLLGAASRELARAVLARGELPDPDLLGAGGDGLPPADAADDFGVRALASAAAGDLGAARSLAVRAVAAADLTDSPIARAAARLDLAHVQLAAARPDAAWRAAEGAASLFAGKGHTVGRAAALRLAATAAARARGGAA